MLDTAERIGLPMSDKLKGLVTRKYKKKTKTKNPSKQ